MLKCIAEAELHYHELVNAFFSAEGCPGLVSLLSLSLSLSLRLSVLAQEVQVAEPLGPSQSI